MENFTMRIEKKYVQSYKMAIGQKRLNIKIVSEKPLSGLIASGEPDTEIVFQLLSENLEELVILGWFAAKEPITFELGKTW